MPTPPWLPWTSSSPSVMRHGSSAATTARSSLPTRCATGAAWQNPYVESFGGRLRDELLAVEAFTSLLEAQVLVEDWRIEYNTVRPHSALGYLTPTDYAKAWSTNHPELS